MFDKSSYRHEVQTAAIAAPLLMLPGTLCDARVFASVLHELDLPAVVPELSGADTAPALARRIIDTMPERASLLGFSLGAVVALEIIAQVPERVERLALLACNPGVLSPEAQSVRRLTRRETFVDSADPRLAHEMARMTTSQAWHDQTAITLNRTDSRPRLAAIRVPVLSLCGAADRICPPPMSRAIANAIPGARFVVIAGAGHYVTLEQPAAVASEIAAWLATPNPLQ